ncbi:hypothetical protein [Caldisalinibacter kiritimatiensis]|uniref:Uncharacterized protein n=1 Tax=Caldisalinibacter kiritimatiensis TaxID=1304284 RepID=R1AUR6_9FIRM|nr:hypothetical protein [Caldisalinibacter kiritimatiensis]EOD00382.1 hypothetical protein L21TH_1573 [Caldisalinibacter kiritimatiensis]
MFMLKALAGGIILYVVGFVLSAIINDIAGVVLILNIIIGMIIIGCTDIIIETIKKYSNTPNKND